MGMLNIVQALGADRAARKQSPAHVCWPLRRPRWLEFLALQWNSVAVQILVFVVAVGAPRAPRRPRALHTLHAASPPPPPPTRARTPALQRTPAAVRARARAATSKQEHPLSTMSYRNRGF